LVTLFDAVTLATFVCLAIGFFLWTDRDRRTLLHFVVSGIVLAFANQVGNAGQTILAIVLLIAAIAYVFVMAWRPAS
jgi:hypothetical protein